MTTEIDYSGIPPHMLESIQGYIEEGWPVGGFLSALLANDLVHAFGTADESNRAAMFAWASFIHNEAPMACWGSKDKVEQWIAQGGVRAYMAKDGG